MRVTTCHLRSFRWLLMTGVLLQSSPGCMSRSKLQQASAEIEQRKQACAAEIAEMTTVAPEPATSRFDGRWQCMYSDSAGAPIREYLMFSTSGNEVTVTGTDNWGANVMASGSFGGNDMAYRQRELGGVRVKGDEKGLMLTGQAQFFVDSSSTCHTTDHCRRL